MTTVPKNVYIDMLHDIVNRYNNTVHKTIKIKPIDVTDGSYAEYSEDFNKKVLNLKLMTNQKRRTNQKEFRIGRILKRKSENLYVKWKGYDNCFNSWINKKDIV